MRILEIVFKVFKHFFTEADNQTYDLGRFLWAFGFIFYLILSFIHYAAFHSPFDPISWSSGLTLILGGGGGTIALKSLEKFKPSDTPK